MYELKPDYPYTMPTVSVFRDPRLCYLAGILFYLRQEIIFLRKNSNLFQTFHTFSGPLEHQGRLTVSISTVSL